VDPILRIEGLSKSYGPPDEPVAALRGIDLTLDAGRFLAVMGASGSGKSTLLHLVAGLEAPSAGRVMIDGRDIASLSDRDRTVFRRQRIGVIFQSFNLLPTLTATENVALPLLIAGMPRSAAKRRTSELLETVDLAHRAKHKPDAMSGGEQQRVAIARALVNDPAVILADEPTGNLDSQHAADVWSLLRWLCDEQSRTLLAVTHEASGAARADRVVVLKDGNITGAFDPKDGEDAASVAARSEELAT